MRMRPRVYIMVKHGQGQKACFGYDIGFVFVLIQVTSDGIYMLGKCFYDLNLCCRAEYEI